MPAPKHVTPRGVTPSKSKRRFTLAQACSALPLVKRIVADIVKAHDDATKMQSMLEIPQPEKQRTRMESDLEAKLDRLQNLVEELHDVGCELKDYKVGLVDFIGRHQGHDVYLCWKLGEERITHWHEMNAGFSGRQPVSVLDERD